MLVQIKEIFTKIEMEEIELYITNKEEIFI